MPLTAEPDWMFTGVAAFGSATQLFLECRKYSSSYQDDSSSNHQTLHSHTSSVVQRRCDWVVQFMWAVGRKC